MLTTGQLLALLADHESEAVELTTSTNNTDKFCQAICAFTEPTNRTRRCSSTGTRTASTSRVPICSPCRASATSALRSASGARSGKIGSSGCLAARSLSLPAAEITPAGYIVMQHAVLGGRPVQAYRKWLRRIPEVYRAEALDEAHPGSVAAADDLNCLATLKTIAA